MNDSATEMSGGFDALRPEKRRKNDSGLNIDRLPPYSSEAEQGVLGCILLSPSDCLNQCVLKFRSGNRVFYDLRHATIYAELIAMADAGEVIDVITVQQRLKDKQLLDRIGGIPYLNALQDAVPSAANLSYYADIVQEKHLLRKMIAACANSVARIYCFGGDVEGLLGEVEREILSVREDIIPAQAGIKELVQQCIAIIEDKHSRQGAIAGLSTGFPDLDRYTEGLCPGELIVPCAYPSVGKTSLLMNMIESVVIAQGRSAVVFTREMTAQQLVMRFLCSNARVNLKRVGRGEMYEADYPRITGASGRVSHSKLYIVEDCETVSHMRAAARRLKQEHQIEAIGVDYIQRVTPESGDNREQQVAGISSGLKSMAVEMRLPVIAPSQLNEDGKLRESRAIGQDADQVWNLEQKEEDKTEESELVDLWIRKNRNGERDVCVHLKFFKCFTRFESVSPIKESDIPQTRAPYSDR